MSYLLPVLKRDIEYYEHRYDNIFDDINEDVVNALVNGNLLGDKIADMKQPPGHFVYKARARNSNANAGKSNGYRIIYYAIPSDKQIYLLTVYYKKDDIRIPSDKQLRDIIEETCKR